MSPNQHSIHDLLYRTPLELGVSTEFLEMAERNDFYTLKDIVSISVNELLSGKRLSYRLLKELTSILESNNALFLLREI